MLGFSTGAGPGGASTGRVDVIAVWAGAATIAGSGWTFTTCPPWTVIQSVVAPNRLATSTVSTSSRRMTRSGTHHDQCHERTVRLVSVSSKIPKGQGRLRQPPVEAVTRYLAGNMSQLCHSHFSDEDPKKDRPEGRSLIG